MGSCCTRETSDVGRPLLYEKLGENGERKGIDEERTTLEQETNENDVDTAATELSNVE